MTTASRPHPTAKTYWLVALFLGVVTAVEVAIPYTDFLGSVGAVLLVLLGAVKFFTVVGIFMHLRYDLTGYRIYFLFGLIGALLVFAVVLATFQAL
jgi:hypothetical protein